jgi:hypothetical protein
MFIPTLDRPDRRRITVVHFPHSDRRNVPVIRLATPRLRNVSPTPTHPRRRPMLVGLAAAVGIGAFMLLQTIVARKKTPAPVYPAEYSFYRWDGYYRVAWKSPPLSPAEGSTTVIRRLT